MHRRRTDKRQIGSVWMLVLSARALQCCKAHAKINRKIENLTDCKIVTHEDFNLKLGTRDYVANITHRATFESNRSSGGFPPNRGNITLLWLFVILSFFSRSCAQVEPMHRFLRWMAQMTCFRPRTVLLRAVNWDMLTKFGLQIDFDLRETVTSTNMKPEVVFSGRGRHLDKWIWRHISAMGAPI